MSNTWTLIRNPKSASGRGGKDWPKISALLKSEGIAFQEQVTEYPGHASEIARHAVLNGSRRLLAVGGDGTVNEIANGLLDQKQVNPLDVTLAQIPVGTGNDWRRTVGIPTDYAKAVGLLKKGRTLVQDVGLVRYCEEGQARQRYFVNMAGMGYDALVGHTANARKADGKGGIFGYVTALVNCLFKYKALPISYQVDGIEKGKGNMFSLTVGIGKFNGGGMKQCPNAILDDGLLDLTVIHELSKFKVIRNIPRLFSGSFIKNKEVFTFQGKEISISSNQENLLEIDGENIGSGTTTFSILKKQLKVMTLKE